MNRPALTALRAVALALWLAAVAGCQHSSSLVASSAQVNTSAKEFFPEPAPGATHWTQQPLPENASPEIRDYFVKFERTAETDSILSIPMQRVSNDGQPLGAQFVQAKLRRSAMLSEHSFFQINGIDRYGPFVRLYEGEIADQPGSLIHLTLADDFIRGSARAGTDYYLIRIGMAGNLPVNLQRTSPEPQPSRIPAAGAPQGCPEDGIPGNHQDPSLPGVNLNGFHRLVPPYLNPQFGLGLSDAPELLARVILDADLDAFADWGRHLPAMMIGLLFEQDTTYRVEVGVRHAIAGVHLNLIKDYFPTPLDQPDPFDQLDAWWGHYKTADRDIVHLLSGQEVGVFKANCIGGAGSPFGYFYTTTQTESADRVHRETANIISHEIGHLYSAHHHYGNLVEAGDGKPTLMFGTGVGVGIGSGPPVFSSLSRSVIRGWAEEFLEPYNDSTGSP